MIQFLSDYTVEQLKGFEAHLTNSIWRGKKFGWLEHMQPHFENMLPQVRQEISKRSLKIA